MKSKVIQLADIHAYNIPENFFDTSIDEQEIVAQMEEYAQKNSITKEVKEYQEGAGIVCKDENNQTVLLYPSMQFVGLEEACTQALSKTIGDTFTTTIKGQEKTLSIEKYLINEKLEIGQVLVDALQIENVDTIEALHSYIENEKSEKKKMANISALIQEYIKYLATNSQIEIDEEEMHDIVYSEAELAFEENLNFGFDMRITDEGMITREEAIERIAEGGKENFIQTLVNRKICEVNDIIVDEEQVKKDALAMGEDEVNLPAIIDNAYFSKAFEVLDKKAKEVLA